MSGRPPATSAPGAAANKQAQEQMQRIKTAQAYIQQTQQRQGGSAAKASRFKRCERCGV